MGFYGVAELTDLQLLREQLAKIDQISNTNWMSALTPRGLAELEFHNKHRDTQTVDKVRGEDTYEAFYGNRKYYATTKRSRRYVEDWIGRMAPGAVFLDYACGNGDMARLAARSGAALAIGLDISDVSIRNARDAAKAEGLESNTYFVQANAEDTRFPSECIDVGICSGMLHHLDLSLAFPELRRITKVGGRILAAEALDYNPAIKLYRYLTPQMRTEWERAHILDLSDLKFAGRFFDVGEVSYWHVMGYAGGKFPRLAAALDAVDRVLERIPLIRLMAWMWTFELIRPPKS